MELRFLGTGSAFVSIKDNYQSNMILKHPNGKILLIDCGSDIRHSLAHYGLGFLDIDAVFISHQHADHCGGLEWLALTRKFSGTSLPKPHLLLHPDLYQPLWDHTLSGGLETLSGSQGVKIEDFFDVHLSDSNHRIVWENIDLEIVPTEHFYNGPNLKPSFGLLITTPKMKVFISGDTRFTPDWFMPYYKQADLVFHDCDTHHKSEVHAHFLELETLPAAIKNKMWLYHYSSIDTFNATASGFKGFVKKGQSFEV